MHAHPQIAPHAARQARRQEVPPATTYQTVTLFLDGITADDYLQWVRDPDPPDAGVLKLITVGAAPLGDRIRVELLVEGDPPPPRLAAHSLGFPMTPEVGAVRVTLGSRSRRPAGRVARAGSAASAPAGLGAL